MKKTRELNSTANPVHFHFWGGWIGCVIQQATSKRLPGFFLSNILIFIYFFKYQTIEFHARAFLPLNISAVGTVQELRQKRWTPIVV